MSTYLGHAFDGERYVNTRNANIIRSFSLRDMTMCRKKIVDGSNHVTRQIYQTSGYVQSAGCRRFSLVDGSTIFQSPFGRSNNFISQSWQYGLEKVGIVDIEEEELLISLRQTRPKSKSARMFSMAFR